MRLRKLPTALLAAVTAAALVAVAPHAASAAPDPGASPARPAGKSTSITLITGDRVVVAPGGQTSIERAPGRAGTRFVSRKAAGHHYVIPVDALPLVRGGRLDQRLFDLTALRDFGYTGEAELPLLLAYPRSGSRKGAASAQPAVGTTVKITRDLGGVGVLAVRAKRTARAELWQSLTTGTAGARALSPGVERVYLDGKRKLDLDVSVPQIGAPSAWQAGLDGTGVTVAILDSGIDATHPDFAGKIVANENFTPRPGHRRPRRPRHARRLDHRGQRREVRRPVQGRRARREAGDRQGVLDRVLRGVVDPGRHAVGGEGRAGDQHQPGRRRLAEHRPAGAGRRGPHRGARRPVRDRGQQLRRHRDRRLAGQRRLGAHRRRGRRRGPAGRILQPRPPGRR
nr:hypothetical protein GCM10020092_072360 [Actinoplanes digitatis]